MPETPNKFYLTTPIYYVNARPHIGHAYSTIAADVIARRHRLLGEDTFFLTGTDEHGQKVQRSAAAAGVPPQQFADEVSASFRSLWDRMGITYSDYIRTTDERHKLGVQKLWRKLEASGDIYLDSYTGSYCVSDEAFVDLPAGTPCPDCGRPLEVVTEENYFFKLSAYAEKIIEAIEGGTLHVQPETTKNEVLSFVRGGLKDLSISRTTFDWGIKVPGNEKHVVYVWLDALANYITAIGYGAEDPAEQAKFAKYWPADIHLVGKEITRFHCVYWPAFLMAAGLPLPRSVVANGWLLFEESKMSKSRGNVVRTETILDAFGEHYRASQVKAGQPEPDKRDCDLFAADVLRYFLLREIPFGQDGSFSFDALITRYNAELANGYGNLVSRVLKMIEQYPCEYAFPAGYEAWDERNWLDYALSKSPGVVQQPGSQEPAPATEQSSSDSQYHAVEHAIRARRVFAGEFGDAGFNALLAEANLAISITDKFLSREAPWKLAKDELASSRSRLSEVLYTAAESIRILTALLYPFMPHTTAKVWAQLGLGSIEEAARNGGLKDLKWGGLKPGTKPGSLAPIFPRADKGLAQIMTDMESSNTAPAAAAKATEPVLADDFSDIKPAAATPSSTNPAAAPRTSDLPASPDSTKTDPAVPRETKPEAAPITIDDFAKIELRVAQIVVAERIPKADKLLRLEVDLGYERRQILSGIAEWYTPEELIGRRIAVIANLAPRKMRGLESHGMLLAASGDDHASKPILATFSDEVALGSKIR